MTRGPFAHDVGDGKRGTVAGAEATGAEPAGAEVAGGEVVAGVDVAGVEAGAFCVPPLGGLVGVSPFSGYFGGICAVPTTGVSVRKTRVQTTAVTGFFMTPPDR
ncbi:MAG: hypothetical protein ACXV3D_09975 [Halobacteriota archaeon]